MQTYEQAKAAIIEMIDAACVENGLEHELREDRVRIEFGSDCVIEVQVRVIPA